MGGMVRVRSTPGEGSDFNFTVRLQHAEEQPEITDDCVIPALAGSEEPRQLSVLVAEDVELNQLVVSRFLEKLGHRPMVVLNGREAVNACLAGGFDLVLMDVQMPEMDGLEATRIIREHEKLHGGHLPIIAMTAHVTSRDVLSCLEAGMDAHLAKPIKSIDLKQVIGSCAPHALKPPAS
jgi:CheY-like chemotaxis protein